MATLLLGVPGVAHADRLLPALAGTQAASPASVSATAVGLPTGFRDTSVLSGLSQPTNVRFASDGRIFVAQKDGLIKIFHGLGDTSPVTFADLRTEVDNYWDRGLLGMALDPNFPASPYVYALYTRDAPLGGTVPVWNDACPNPPGATADGCVVSGRLVRLTASGDTATATKVLVDDWCQQFPSHSIGELNFGPDGALYASGGDGASFNNADYGQYGSPKNPCGDPPTGSGGIQTPPTAEGGALRAQDVRTTSDPAGLNGSIIRIDPATGDALQSNPLASSGDPNARRIVAHGFRNPFRFAIRPGTNELWAGDVGWNDWEEIDRIASPTSGPANFGWPCYEGAGRQPAYDALNLNICEDLYGTPGAVTAPFFTYNHASTVVGGEACPTGSSSISGLAFYTGSSYPASYAGALFFTDYSRKCIWVMPVGANGLPDPTLRQTFETGTGGPVNLQTGPGGDLFYPDLDGGTIHRIQYFAANRPPTAVAKATPASGAAPLAVSFDATGSSDPDAGDTLTYAWDLDADGAYDDSTAAKPSFTFTTAGRHTVGLKVTDSQGASGTDSIAVTVGTPPTATIASPVATTLWKVGDTIAFSGSATDPVDGTLPASALKWSVLLHHCSDPTTCHVHPVQDFNGVASGSFPAPDHDYPSWLEITLTATDSLGLTDTKSLRLDPKTVDLTFNTAPTGMQLTVGSSSGTGPFTRRVIVGSSNLVTAPATQTLGASTYSFTSWSDGGAASHSIVAPAAAASYTANYGASTAGATLVGSSGVQSASDSNPAGQAEAFRATAAASGTLASLSVYVDGGSTATKLVAGLYADASGKPGALLTQGTLASPAKGAWNRLAVPSVGITAGRDYWVAVLAPPGSGTLAFRDAVATTNGRAETSASASLSALPTAWATGAAFRDGPLSAYGSAAGAAAAPILAVSPASLSFSATQGGADPAPRTLTVANSGSGALSWSAADDAAWLTESPAAGTAPGTVSVSSSAAGLAAGTYNGRVTVTASGAQGSPASVPVTLTVSAPPPPGVTTLVGAQTVQPQADYNLAGTAEAFEIATAAAGTLSTLNVYLDAGANATKVVAGLYADAAGHPGALLAQGSTALPTAGAWNKITVPATAIQAGKSYWVAIMGTGTGIARFRDKPKGCRSETSSQSTLTALPAAWSTGSLYTDCPLSAYGTT